MEYQIVEYKLHEGLTKFQEMLSLLEFDEPLSESLTKCKELIETKKYRLAVMGEFKRGKSSLINALLGSKILPADVNPATATLCRITYGTTRRVVVEYKDGRAEDIKIDELQNYVAKNTKKGSQRAALIRESVIYFPAAICQNHVDIIDTPGLDDDDAMTQINIETLPSVDAVIVPISARAPFSETEKKFVCQLIERENIGTIVFVVTFMDMLDKDEYNYDRFIGYIKDRIRGTVFAELERTGSPHIAKAHAILDDLYICGISSKLALEYFVSNDREKLAESRFDEFKSSLLGIVTAGQSTNAAQKTVNCLKKISSEFENQHQKKLRFFQEEENQMKELENAADAYCAQSKKFLDSVFARDYESIEGIVNKTRELENRIYQILSKEMEAIISAINDIKKGSKTELTAEALNYFKIKATELANKYLEEKIISGLTSYFETESKELQEYIGSDEKLKGLYLISCKTKLAEMFSFASKVLNNVVFEWIESPSEPAIVTLTRSALSLLNASGKGDEEQNIFENSIQNLHAQLREAIKIIRKKWFVQWENIFLTIKATDLEPLKARREQLDAKTKKYTNNYQIFYNRSKNIASECEKIWNEYLKGNVKNKNPHAE